MIPNLDYDPQNPTDLLGNPIAEGDTVAWGTTWGRSPALCIAKIAKIRYFTRFGRGYGSSKPCPRDQAEGYNLVLEPIKSTGSITVIDKLGEKHYPRQEDIDAEPERYTAKLKTITHVKNVVKL